MSKVKKAELGVSQNLGKSFHSHIFLKQTLKTAKYTEGGHFLMKNG